MKSYISYFKLKFITGLQYRSAALAGIVTQIFFGFVYISVYLAFYESNPESVSIPIGQLVSYLWLCQSFLALIYLWYKDKEIINLIKSGNIAYELSRPQDLYLMWASKILGERLSMVSLRCLPVLLIALILPGNYKLVLNISLPTLILFIITLILATFLMTVLVLFFHIMCLYTIDEKGIVNLFMILADILSGTTIPIPFFPDYLKNITNILPFRYICDLPFRFLVGNVPFNDVYIGIIIQIIWIIILFILGKILTTKALKKAVIQGG